MTWFKMFYKMHTIYCSGWLNTILFSQYILKQYNFILILQECVYVCVQNVLCIHIENSKYNCVWDRITVDYVEILTNFLCYVFCDNIQVATKIKYLGHHIITGIWSNEDIQEQVSACLEWTERKNRTAFIGLGIQFVWQ